MTIRIAHLSDPHILDLTGVPRSRLLLSKRVTGWMNIKLSRGSTHKRHVVEAMMDDLRESGVDHVVITGDMTNLALESEFERACEVFARAGFAPENLSVIPGNHDVYTRGSERAQRFAKYFAANITSDIPMDAGTNHPSGPFPFVRLRGNAAIIGLSSAVSRMPLIASGRAGVKQLEALEAILAHPEVAKRTPVILIHHPLINPPGYLGTLTHGLREGRRIRKLLSARRHTMVLHGHLHDRAHRIIEAANGSIVHHIGATSASLIHSSPHRVAGYNIYTIGDQGLESVSARVFDPETGHFLAAPVRERSARFAT